MIYSVVLISAVQQSDSVFRFLSIMVYHRILNIVPRVLQEDFVVFLKKIIYLFIYGCVGSSFLCEGFL